MTRVDRSGLAPFPGPTSDARADLPPTPLKPGKEHPYLPARNRHLLGQRLNGTVALAIETDSAGATAPCCRHFSQAYYEFAGSKGKFLDRATKSAESVRAYFATHLERLNQAHAAMVRATPEIQKHLVDEERLGAYLDLMIDTLLPALPAQEGAEIEAGIQLLTQDHVMNAHVELKRENDVGVRACISVFDSTTASTQRRYEVDVSDLSRPLACLGLKDLMPDPDFMKFYSDRDGRTRLCAVSIDVRLAVESMHFAETPQSTGLQAATVMCMALLSNMPSLVRSVAARLPQACDKEQLLHVLHAVGRRGIPALYTAVHRELPEGVEAFVKLVAHRHDLDSSERMRLLSATAFGQHALLTGAEEGSQRSVQVLVDGIVDSRLDAAHVEWLLTGCATPDSPTPLVAAAKRGHTVIVDSLMDGLLRSGLDPDCQFKILARCTPRGQPAFYKALVKGHFDSARAIAAGLAKLPLSLQQKEDVLAGWSADGVSLLDVAPYAPHADRIFDAWREACALAGVDAQKLAGDLGARLPPPASRTDASTAASSEPYDPPQSGCRPSTAVTSP